MTTTPPPIGESAPPVAAAAKAMRTSRLAWGLHAELMRDEEQSREFWTEAATIALTAAGVIPPEASGSPACTCGSRDGHHSLACWAGQFSQEPQP